MTFKELKEKIKKLEKKSVDFINAKLIDVDLTSMMLDGRDLRGADLDYYYFPLSCASLDAKVDARIARQLAYHLCRLECDDEEYLEIRGKIKDFANKFHRVEECGRIE